MCPAESPTWLRGDDVESLSEASTRSRRPWAKGLIYAGETVKRTLRCSYRNVLLVFVPLGIISGALGWNSMAVFILNILAIFPLAAILSYATDELSAKLGQIAGGLINATFGNAIEIIVCITALKRGEIRFVQSGMVGSVLSSTLIILGSCFFFAGQGRDRVTFNTHLTSIMSSLTIVSSASLVVPSALYSTFTPSESLDLEHNVLVLSRITSIILLVFYIMYLYFQLKSHAHLFSDDNVVEADESYELDSWAASIVLIIATVGVTVCASYLVDSIDGIIDASHVSRAFIGLITVPILGNTGDYATTVNAAMKGKLDLAVGIVFGSTLQIALFVTPFLVILGWIIGQPMTLHFDTFEAIVLFLAVLVVNCLLREGRTNYIEGALLIGMYFLIVIAFYVHPDIVDKL